MEHLTNCIHKEEQNIGDTKYPKYNKLTKVSAREMHL